MTNITAYDIANTILDNTKMLLKQQKLGDIQGRGSMEILTDLLVKAYKEYNREELDYYISYASLSNHEESDLKRVRA